MCLDARVRFVTALVCFFSFFCSKHKTNRINIKTVAYFKILLNLKRKNAIRLKYILSQIFRIGTYKYIGIFGKKLFDVSDTEFYGEFDPPPLLALLSVMASN